MPKYDSSINSELSYFNFRYGASRLIRFRAYLIGSAVGWLIHSAVSAQMPPNVPPPFLNPQTFVGSTGKNGDAAQCPSDNPSNGQTGGVPDSYSTTNTDSASSPTFGTGILVTSTGGTGGVGGEGFGCFSGYGGGYGGDGGSITINNGQSPVTSPLSPALNLTGTGIMAVSQGGQGGQGGGTGSTLPAGNGGPGGAGGAVNIANFGSINTNGLYSFGLYGASVGGGGGAGGVNQSQISGSGGDGMAGGVGGSVSLSNSGSISTTNAYAMFGISMGGYGGSSGSNSGIFASPTPTSGYGGAGGQVSVQNLSTGQLTTNGAGQAAMMGISVGGGGGDAGRATGIGQFGANGGPGASGGQVTAFNSGMIQTLSSASIGMGAISVGGGGGSGGSAQDALFGGGGNGGGGGDGGLVTATNTGSIYTGGGASATSAMTTGGGVAPALAAVSVGGGGGVGGSVVGGGVGFSLSLGGKGGDGGKGGPIWVNNSNVLQTTEVTSAGIFAGSIGGGGGLGGGAFSASVGTSTVSIAIGGSGGSGGDGGTIGINCGQSNGSSASSSACANATAVSSAVSGSNINTLGAIAPGIAAFSVGGGGGHGGYGLSLAAGTNMAAALSSGGSGGDGGSGGEIYAGTNAVPIQTAGDLSAGLVAFSVGGGGGHGGITMYLPDYVPGGAVATTSVSINVGGSGGGSGAGGSVIAENIGSSITTLGDRATGMFVGSVGGHGGHGGLASGGAVGLNTTASVSVGGNGGSGNDAGAVTVNNINASISTQGADSHGIEALSIGGGGGSGGWSAGAGVSLGGNATSFTIGGTGGSGGNGGAVNVSNSGKLSVYGLGAAGILGLSVGGGGGNGGSSASSDISLNGVFTETVGGFGTGGATSGTVTLTNTAGIFTGLSFASSSSTPALGSQGMVALSIAGGGGRGGVAVSGDVNASTDGSTQSLMQTIGGGSGGGGTAGAATLTNAGQIQTYGDLSNGLLAMSVGGRGGLGGIAVGGSVSVQNTTNITLGSDGGNGGKGGDASITNSGSVSTGGFRAIGASAQSLGGHGGMGGISVGTTIASADSGGASITLGGTGGKGGVGGSATVTHQAGAIVNTTGPFSAGLVAQSIGGDGGLGGIGLGISTTTKAPSMSLGGSGGDGALGGDASITSAGSVLSSGNNSVGILAQSIGGNGGFSGVTIAGGSSDRAGNFPNQLGSQGGSGATGGSASVSVSGPVTTQGLLSSGIAVESIGGGGGRAGTAMTLDTGNPSNLQPFGAVANIGATGGGGGNGGAATLNQTGAVSTNGPLSEALYAGSIGGGGGSAGLGFFNFTSGSKSFTMAVGGQSGSDGDGGGVTVYANNGLAASSANVISSTQEYSHGIFAQSVGGGGGSAVGIHKQASAAGAFEGLMRLGSTGGSGGTGGTLNLNTGGAVNTAGIGSSAVFGQSIGGGGGQALTGLVAATTDISIPGTNIQFVVGSGSASNPNGSAGTSTTAPSTSISLTAFSQTTLTAGSAGSVSLGGFSTSPGDGGDVTMSSGSKISTVADMSDGIKMQSIGGGGGVSALADVLSGSPFAGSTMFLGGGESGGGVGGTVTVTNNGSITTNGGLSLGIFAQSLGGGGGDARHTSLATAGLTSAFAVGQGLPSDAKGGTAGAVSVTNNQQISTTGLGSYGMVAQAIGGGGGFSGLYGSAQSAASYPSSSGSTVASSQAGVNPDSYSVDSSSSASFAGKSGSNTRGGASVSTVTGTSMAAVLGASGGSINNAGSTVNLYNDGSVQTVNDGSSAIVAQSVGAGGGIVTQHGSNFDQSQTNLSLMLGALESAYGSGADITVTNGATTSASTNGVTTSGHAAMGVLAQSIGGGGGLGVLTASTIGQGGTASLSMALGGSGSTYGDSGSVTVNATNPISTTGDLSQAILAQSISNGGGVAKTDLYSAVGGPKSSSTQISAHSGSLNSAQAGDGLAAAASLGTFSQTGSSTDTVTINSSAALTTSGVRSGAIVAQSISGGGGVIDIATNSLNSGNVAASVNLGGAAASAGSNVTVQSSGSISTSGALSDGILAQSISGGGGSFGFNDVGVTPVSNGVLSFALGSNILSSNQTNPSTVSVNSQQSISTSGFGSTGITAQAIGGGGGLVAYNYARDFEIYLGASGLLGMTANSQSDGYAVSVQTGSGITTSGTYATGIVAQSIGGGGGRVVGNQASSAGQNISLGSSSGGGSGGSVNLNLSGPITTNGLYSNGIVAQSIGAGGGIIDLLANNVTLGALPAAVGSGGVVTVTQSGAITTNGSGIGILAMSIGGGGGFATVTSVPTFTIGAGTKNTSNGGAVTVNVNAPIYTKGIASPGVLAVSIGGGGGVITNAEQAPLQVNDSKGSGSGGNVIVNVNSSIKTTGLGSDGVDAVSIGGGGAVFLSGDSPIFYSASGTGYSGSVTVNVANNVTIQTQGPPTLGINVAQVNGAGDPEVNIGKGALVEGGSEGIGVRFAGAVNTLNNEGTVQTAGGVGGRAIVSDSGLTTLNNRGVIKGAIHLNGTGNIVNNAQGAQILTSALNLGQNSVLTNAGYVQFRSAEPGSIGSVKVSGTFNQLSTGVLGFEFDHHSGQAHSVILSSDGRMNLSGYVYPEITNNAGLIRPGSNQTTLIHRNEGILNVDQLGVISTAIMNFGLIKEPDRLVLTSTANFAPAGLSNYASQVGRSIGEYQSRGSNPFFQSATAQLVKLPTVGSLDQAYVGLAGTSISAVPKVTYEAVSRAVDTFSDRMNSWRVGGGIVGPSTNSQAIMTAQGLPASVMGPAIAHDMAEANRTELSRPPSGSTGIRTWVTPFQVDTSTNDLSNKVYGGSIGIDTESSNGKYLAGAGFTISQSNFTYDNSPTPRTPGSTTNYGASLYFGARYESAYISAIGYIGGGNTSLNRQIQGLGINDSTKLNVQNFTLAARIEAGYHFLLNPQSQYPVQLTPFVAIQPTQIRQKSANESFSSLGSGFSYSAKTNTAVPVSLGAELSGTFSLGDKETLRPFIRASWTKDTANSGNMGANYSAMDGVSIFSNGSPSYGNTVALKAGVKYNNGSRASAYATLDLVKGLNSSNYKGIGGTVGVIYRW